MCLQAAVSTAAALHATGGVSSGAPAAAPGCRGAGCRGEQIFLLRISLTVLTDASNDEQRSTETIVMMGIFFYFCLAKTFSFMSLVCVIFLIERLDAMQGGGGALITL